MHRLRRGAQARRPLRREAAPVGWAYGRGMLPVRRMRGAAGQRDWWELNEQGTILRGERSGASIRLGDPIEVRVARVEAVRGRVDLLAAAPRPALSAARPAAVPSAPSRRV